MKITLIGYKFFEKELAKESRSALVIAKALPKKKGDVTLYWQDYEEAALDKPIFYYMRGDKSMIATMGEPKKFQVTVPGEKDEVPNLPGEGGINFPPKPKL